MTATATAPTSVTAEELRAGLTELLAQVKETGTPLTVDGGFVVLPAAEYGRLVERADDLKCLEEVEKGLQDVEAGRVKPAAVAFAELETKLFGAQLP